MLRPFKLLLVEKERDGSLRRTLERTGQGLVEIESAGELAEALKRLSQGGIDVVLLELTLPDSQGTTTFERTYAFAPDVPLVVITDDYDDELAVSIVQAGAQDYLVRGSSDGDEIMRSLRYALERHRMLMALRSLSLMDDLTNLYNRRGFIDLGTQYLEVARRSNREITLVFLDLDRFKTINDSLGHHIGDRALRRVAEILRTTFRRSDIIARMGGDEFAVLAMQSSEDSTTVITRLREQFSQFDVAHREPYHISVSIGAAQDDSSRRLPLEELLYQADAAMYKEKRAKLKGAASR